jgi:hypothetical protein
MAWNAQWCNNYVWPVSARLHPNSNSSIEIVHNKILKRKHFGELFHGRTRYHSHRGLPEFERTGSGLRMPITTAGGNKLRDFTILHSCCLVQSDFRPRSSFLESESLIGEQLCGHCTD